MSQATKVKSFYTSNDTDKWALIIDGFFQLTDSEQQAFALKKLVIGDNVESSPFGSWEILAPNETKNAEIAIMFGEADKISNFEETDLLEYKKQCEQEIIDRVKSALNTEKLLQQYLETLSWEQQIEMGIVEVEKLDKPEVDYDENWNEVMVTERYWYNKDVLADCYAKDWIKRFDQAGKK